MVSGPPIADAIAAEHRAAHRARRSFGPDDFERFLELLNEADAVLTVRDAFGMAPDLREGIIALRHDVDHDLENALAVARIEAEHGFRASFYLLHTDWYYRCRLGEGPPCQSLLEAAAELVSLGHEVALHNNVITQALLTERRPRDVLEAELGYLRAAGFSITGSVAHGDPLCHQLGYINYEIFAECAKPARGAPDRVIVLEDWDAGLRRQVRLEPFSMRDVGLDYEANLIGHRLYLSDSGGRWHVPLDDVHADFRERRAFLQVLMHPVWWALEGEPFTPRASAPPR
jgi:hypothetical protein